jgi:hypothetical protein
VPVKLLQVIVDGMNGHLPWIQTHPVGRIAVVLVWHLATAFVIIGINLRCQLHFQKIQSVTLLMLIAQYC